MYISDVTKKRLFRTNKYSGEVYLDAMRWSSYLEEKTYYDNAESIGYVLY